MIIEGTTTLNVGERFNGPLDRRVEIIELLPRRGRREVTVKFKDLDTGGIGWTTAFYFIANFEKEN